MSPPAGHAPRIDGRLLRGERARTCVAEALLSLLSEGDVRPTAPRIADRAGVSLRTLFHHFTDLESLFQEVSRRQMDRLADLVAPIPLDLPFPVRLDHFTRQRSRLLEGITPVRRAALLYEPFSESVSAGVRALRQMKRAQVAHVFQQELSRFPPAEQQEVLFALGTATSWSAWNDLRSHQGLPATQARGAMARLIRSLLLVPSDS